MRHTRNRQLFKLTGHPHWKSTYSVPIWMNLKWKSLGLDKSFKWHKLFNQVSYQEPYKGLDSYVIVNLYSNRTHRIVKF